MGDIMYNKLLRKTNISYGNRGMDLENDINESNTYYLNNNIAVIHKKPTPINIHKVDYKSRYDAVITKATFKIPSTTDYNGIYRGYYIDFEAKETTSTTSFPLSNIHNHQLEHMKKISEHKGISFIIVSFTKLQKVYLIEIEKILEYINDTNKKSIPLNIFDKCGYLLKYKFAPRLDYLSAVDIIIGGNNEKSY